MSDIYYLMGSTNSNDIVFANIKFKDNRLSISFDVYNPVAITDDYLQSCAEDFVDTCDNSTAYYLCKQFDCRPSDLVTEVLTNFSDEELLGNVTFNYDLNNNDGIEYGLNFISCGQCGDYFKNISNFTNEANSFMIYLLWREYHLKKIEDKCEIDCINNILNKIKTNDIYADYNTQANWLNDFICEMEE